MENWNLLVFTKNKCVSENGNILMKTEDAKSLLNTIAIETCVQMGIAMMAYFGRRRKMITIQKEN
nr:hypothetical protein [Soonwooa sp.]